MINLGDEVRDIISGFQGIATARHTYLQGCDRISVQPPIDKEGKLPEAESFDEPQLEAVKAKKAKRETSERASGGPEKYKDKGRIVK